MSTAAATETRAPEPFRHEALFYAGEDGFLAGTVPFLSDGVAAGEPTLVVVSARKIDRLRDALGDDADRIVFADMAEVGDNPGRIIPAWREFVDDHSSNGRLRGIGEPIYPERNAAEMVECHRHEALLNLAFADAEDFWLVCPYDTDALAPEVIEESQRTHPHLASADTSWQSDTYLGLDGVAAPFDHPFPDPPGTPSELAFDGASLEVVRRYVASHAAAAGMQRPRTDDLLIAVTELAGNSVRHGGGAGTLRVWREHGALVCEVTDGGLIDLPLAGRQAPMPDQVGGYGLWMANQLCELVQVRSFEGRTVMRLHMRLTQA